MVFLKKALVNLLNCLPKEKWKSCCIKLSRHMLCQSRIMHRLGMLISFCMVILIFHKMYLIYLVLVDIVDRKMTLMYTGNLFCDICKFFLFFIPFFFSLVTLFMSILPVHPLFVCFFPSISLFFFSFFLE